MTYWTPDRYIFGSVYLALNFSLLPDQDVKVEQTVLLDAEDSEHLLSGTGALKRLL